MSHYSNSIILSPATTNVIESYHEREGECRQGECRQEVFYTVGRIIRHAVTGDITDMNHRRGTKYEDLYFSVAVAGNLQGNASSAQRLYFYSPIECERTLGISLTASDLEKWESKRDMALRSIGIDMHDGEDVSSKKRYVVTQPSHNDMYYPTACADGRKTTTVHIRHFRKPVSATA